MQDATPPSPGETSPADEFALVPPGIAGDALMGELLFQDLLWLFAAGDTDGGLMSLERMLVLAPDAEHVRSFLRINEVKLVELFDTVLGPWSNVPRKTNRDDVGAWFRTGTRFEAILRLVDGKRNLTGVLAESPYPPLETCAVLNQLLRTKVIEVLGSRRTTG